MPGQRLAAECDEVLDVLLPAPPVLSSPSYGEGLAVGAWQYLIYITAPISVHSLILNSLPTLDVYGHLEHSSGSYDNHARQGTTCWLNVPDLLTWCYYWPLGCSR
jgi:hypothetical protein